MGKAVIPLSVALRSVLVESCRSSLLPWRPKVGHSRLPADFPASDVRSSARFITIRATECPPIVVSCQSRAIDVSRYQRCALMDFQFERSSHCSRDRPCPMVNAARRRTADLVSEPRTGTRADHQRTSQPRGSGASHQFQARRRGSRWVVHIEGSRLPSRS